MSQPLPDPSAKAEPLSTVITRLLDEPNGRLTINGLLQRTAGRGIFLFLILLCLPFITPVPLPGVSLVVGGVVVILGWRHGLGLTARLPAWLGERELPLARRRRVLQFSLKFVRLLERLARPRHHRCLNGCVLAALGLLLTLPLPVPFTNSLPGYAVILISASIMERDGLLIWAGYLVGLLALAYLVFIVVGGVHLFGWSWRSLHPGGLQEGTP
jgi:hypothetical protein